MATTELRCEECGYTHRVDLVGHILEEHTDLGLRGYIEKHPNSLVEVPEMAEAWRKYNKDIVRTPVVGGCYDALLHGVKFRIDTNIPEEVCAPAPPYYHFPEHGEAAKKAKRVVRYIAEGRSTWIYGPPGIGKDALVHYVSALARRPFLFFSITPETRIQDWFFSLSFKGAESTYEEGALLRGLRDGYRVEGEDTPVPYIILLSDLDRATIGQVERLRTLLDTDTKRIPLPRGGYAEMCPGTVIVATANTMGDGDETGRIVSARRIDSSILNRFERKVQMGEMEWKDQHSILRQSHPGVVRLLREANLLTALENTVTALQTECSKGTLFAEFSLRDLRNIMDELASLLQGETKKSVIQVEKLLKDAFDVYFDGLGLRDTRQAAKMAMQPHLSGSKTWSGDLTHLLGGELDLV